MTTIYTESEQAAWRDCTTYLRSEIKQAAALRRPHKLASRKMDAKGWPEYPQSLLWHERCQIRALYLIYGLLRGKSWQQIENTHPEPVEEMRGYLVTTWHQMLAKDHVTFVPNEIAGWLS